MKFGVMICRYCHYALGVELRFKSTICPHCNKRLNVQHADIKYKDDSEIALSTMVSKINEQLQQKKARGTSASYPDFGEVILGSEINNSAADDSKPGKVVYENLDPFQRIVIKYKDLKNKKGSMEFLVRVVTELGTELGEFTTADFAKLLETFELDADKVDELLAELKRLDVVFEPRPGTFKLLEK
ncbi:hypothetical protein [[Eubacterium] cellulosolvens]